MGQVVPFITGSEISLAGTPQNTIERQQVGLNLQVTPRISPDDLVVMTVTATNDRLRPLNEGVPVAIAPNGDPILSPIVDSIAAQTSVSAVSGQTVVLSGLITKENNALHRRVSDSRRYSPAGRSISLRFGFHPAERTTDHPHPTCGAQPRGIGDAQASGIGSDELVP